MAPSFISMLMGADKRPSPATTATVPTQPSNVTLPHLVRGRSARADGLQFGLPMGGFQRTPFGNPQTAIPPQDSSTTHWNDRQKVQDFFRHTTSNNHHNDSNNSDSVTEDEKAAQIDNKAIDVRELVSNSTPDSRDSSTTSSTSSEDNQQDELRGAVRGRGRLQSALEDLLARQQAEEQSHLDEERVEESSLRKKERRRYDSFDIMADVRLEDEDQMDDLDSVYSTPARSRNNSEDFFGGGLLDMQDRKSVV